MKDKHTLGRFQMDVEFQLDALRRSYSSLMAVNGKNYTFEQMSICDSMVRWILYADTQATPDDR